MRSFHPWPIFPHDLESPAAKSLSLLFILQEFLFSLQLLEQERQTAPQEVTEIADRLERFLVLSIDNPFAKNGGALDKLCFYCESLLQASKIHDETLLLLLEDMRNSVLKVKTRIVTWTKRLSAPEEWRQSLAVFYEELDKKFREFFSALFPFLQESRTNENILIHLVEYRGAFNHHLGEKAIENLLCSLFPSGLYELRTAICEGYTRRGFADFYKKQEALLDAIEWEAPACPPCLN
jgi:hypothetical protein